MFHLAMDRREGRTAVLFTDDGEQVDLPASVLPDGAREGDIFSVTVELDEDATRRTAEESRAIQDELKKHDPGWDIIL